MTKFLDMKYHFVREYVELGVVKVLFVMSENNRDDPFTKNVYASMYNRHN